MKRRLFWLLLLPVLGLFWALRSAASWRPQLFGVQARADYPWFSHDGRLLNVGDVNSLAGGQIWDVSERRPLWQTRDVPLGFSRDSRDLLLARVNSPAASEYKSLDVAEFELRDARSGRLIRAFKNRHPWTNQKARDLLLDVGLSGDGRELCVVSAFHLQRFDASNGRLLQDTRWPKGTNAPAELVAAAISFDRKWIVAYDSGLVFFDAQSGKQLRRLPNVRRAYNDSVIMVTADNALFVESSASANRTRVSLVSSGQHLWSSPDWPTFSFDGKRAFVPASRGLDVRDARTGKIVTHLPGPGEYGFAPSPDGNSLFEARDDKIWKWRAR